MFIINKEDKMSVVPTLLVGLGGIGSQIVESVYKRVPVDKRDGIAVHAFDTNINDIRKRTYLKDHITQTSTSITVGQYLQQAENEDESILEWFPHEIELIKRKTMVDGAGQIRCVSRLAYLAAMKERRLEELDKKIGDIFVARGDKNFSSVRVMIVTSLAGGTGAGIFLQTALYLRDLFKNKLGKESVLVRGAFLLPDVLVHTYTVPEDQWEDIRSNAYACFKELDAITKSAYKQLSGLQTVNIEFEYRPDQIDHEGRRDFLITKENLPYDFCFLFDYLSLKGEHINSLDNYLNQMISSIYIQLFSPISDENFSIEDNLILQLIKGKGSNRYCAAGTSVLNYPYEDLVDFFALKMAVNSISREWRKVDEEYEIELRNYEKELKRGDSRAGSQINKAKRYNAIIQQYAKAIKPDPFFYNIYLSTQVKDEREKETISKAEKFLSAIELLVKNTIDNDTNLKQLENECIVDTGLIRNRSKSEKVIADTEYTLDVFKSEVYNAIHNHKNFIFKQIIGDDCDKENGLSGNDDFRLNTWILKKNNPMHPVAVRYFIYDLITILENEIRKRSIQNENLKKGIEKYKDKYAIEIGKIQVESAEERINYVLNQNFITKMFKNKFNDFISFYIAESSQQIKKLTEYLLNSLREKVFSELLASLLDMQKDWDNYFLNLKSVETKLKHDLDILARKHEETANPTIKYILATKKEKETEWEHIRTKISHSITLPDEICASIYLGQFKYYCIKRQADTQSTDSSKLSMDTEDLFRRTVLAWCKKKVLEYNDLNLNIIDALKKKYRDKKEYFPHVKEEMGRIDQLAQPNIFTSSYKTKTIAYWGIHTECTEKSLNEKEVKELFIDKLVDKPVFSKYEIIRYRSLYGLFAEDIPTFSAGNNEKNVRVGAYYKSYKKRISKINKSFDSAVTPHLDKRWHLQAYMPEINKQINIDQEKRIVRAFLLGIIYERLIIVDRDQKIVWECLTGKLGRKSIIMNGKTVEGYYYHLYEAMFYNPSLVDSTIEYVDNTWQKEKKELIDNPEGSSISDEKGKKDKWIQGSLYEKALSIKMNSKKIDSTHKDTSKKPNTILDVIFKFVSEAPDQDVVDITGVVIRQLLDEIKFYTLKRFGQHQENRSKMIAKDFIQDLKKQSKHLLSLDNYLQDRWESLIDSYIVEQLSI